MAWAWLWISRKRRDNAILLEMCTRLHTWVRLNHTRRNSNRRSPVFQVLETPIFPQILRFLSDASPRSVTGTGYEALAIRLQIP